MQTSSLPNLSLTQQEVDACLVSREEAKETFTSPRRIVSLNMISSAFILGGNAITPVTLFHAETGVTDFLLISYNPRGTKSMLMMSTFE